jgi:hypothetical protein
MTLTKKILPLAAMLALVVPGTALAKGPKAKLQFSQPAYAVAENGGSATITVYRQGNAKRRSQAASVDYATSDGSAVAGVDYTEAHGTLNFAIGQTETTFSVPINDKDSVNTGPRTIHLTLSHATATNGAVLGYPSTATLVISDDDPTPVAARLRRPSRSRPRMRSSVSRRGPRRTTSTSSARATSRHRRRSTTRRPVTAPLPVPITPRSRPRPRRSRPRILVT